MNLIETAKAMAVEGVEFGMRCSMCDGREEAEGTLGVQIGPGQFMEVPVGLACLTTLQKLPVQWVDNPNEVE